MMETITLTSKRQATLPAKLCEEIGVKPGDKLVLQRHIIDNKPAWVLRTPASLDMPWFGTLHEYALGKSHDMSDIRASIGKAVGENK